MKGDQADLERKRRNAKAWDLAHPGRVAARARAWEATHPASKRAYNFVWYRKTHPRPECATAGCTTIIEPGQLKFCRECNSFYERTQWA